MFTAAHRLLLLALLLLGLSGCQCMEPIQVMCEINGFLIPAIIDTGAEITVMSAACAKRCHISEAIDTQYSGKAIGVGTSDIIGGIDDLSFRIGPVNFQNKVSILKNSRCDFLIGLDILRRFNCDISVGERILKLSVKGNKIRIPFVGNGRNPKYNTEKTGKVSSDEQERPERPQRPQRQERQERQERERAYQPTSEYVAFPLGSSPVLSGGYREEKPTFTLEELLGGEEEEDLEKVSMEGV
jgi:hypothetical protein